MLLVLAFCAVPVMTTATFYQNIDRDMEKHQLPFIVPPDSQRERMDLNLTRAKLRDLIKEEGWSHEVALKCVLLLLSITHIATFMPPYIFCVCVHLSPFRGATPISDHFVLVQRL